jgi:hypothetical protein
MVSSLPSVRRIPGQSIRDRKERLTDNWLIPLYFTFAFAWVLWGLEFYKEKLHQPPHPNIFLCVAIVATGCAVIGLRRLIPKFQNLNRGELGELKVGEILDELKQSGYKPIHGITRNGFDIDHVVVGPAGVFVIETKFRSGHGTINFRSGEGLFVNGAPDIIDRDPVAQAKGNAAEVRKIIKEHCNLTIWTTAVVVFVGSWKVKENWYTTDVRVQAADKLLEYFDRQDQPNLTRAEINLIASHLERCARN